MMTKALKGTIAAAAGIALGLSGVAAAQAQDGENPGTLAAGDVDSEYGVQLHGEAIVLENTDDDDELEEVVKQQDPRAHMINLDLGDGETRTVYCIQLQVPLQGSLSHVERPWDDVPVTDLPKVLGVLVNGYDGSNAADLIAAAMVEGQEFGDYSADQVAYAGTQSAIWSLTDRWTLKSAGSEGTTDGNADVDAAVQKIQDYLVAESEPIDEPDFEPSFEVDDSAAVAEGATVGPFTVATNLDSITFGQPEGATIVDENGEEVTSFTDGQTFYVEFAEEKDATVTLVTDTVTWTTPAGRTFVPVDAEGADVEGQRLILAEDHTSEYAAEIEFEIAVEEVPSESPKPQLPVTGSSLTTVATVGGAVLLAGVVALVLMRRRRAANWGSDA